MAEIWNSDDNGAFQFSGENRRKIGIYKACPCTRFQLYITMPSITICSQEIVQSLEINAKSRHTIYNHSMPGMYRECCTILLEKPLSGFTWIDDSVFVLPSRRLPWVFVSDAFSISKKTFLTLFAKEKREKVGDKQKFASRAVASKRTNY